MITEMNHYQCKAHVDLVEMDGEWVVFDAESCKVTKLNELGGMIWTCLQEQTDIRVIVARVREEYDIDQETAERDCYQFMNHLREIGLLEIHHSGE